MFFKRYNKNIQTLLEKNVPTFEAKHTSLHTGIKYWGSFFSTTDIGRMLRSEIQNVIGEHDESGDIGRCSEFVLYILQNFDYFKDKHPDLYFPVKNLGRCRITALNTAGENIPIPHYKFVIDEILYWDYHEVIVIINDDDLDFDKNLISNSILDNAKIFDIGMNTKYILNNSGFLRDLVASGPRFNIQANHIPDNLRLQISHRYIGVLIDSDDWSNLNGTSVRVQSSWFLK